MSMDVRRVKQEKLATQTRHATQTQRQNVRDGSDDSDEDEIPRRTRKRVRVSEAIETAPIGGARDEDEDDDEEGEEQEEEQDAPARPRPTTLPRAADGYVPGSIVRVLLKNFVTYDYVEFCPGPYLNMIIGPNGTGKSSIACALCIGLGWPPSILGRASELKAFVKNGCEEGFIEIELKGVLGKPNLVIRRHLNAADNKSIWKLNGQETTQKDVQTRVQLLNVQVDNLCTFLPQDKVSSFASMSPQQLLKETQKAAGDPNLTKWHQTLIDGAKNLREVDESLKVDQSAIEDKQNKNARLEREVAKYKERREIERKIAILNILLPACQLWEARRQQREAARLRDKLKVKLQKLNKKNEPLQDLRRTLENVVKGSTSERDAVRGAMMDAFKAMGRKWSDAEKLEAEAQETHGKMDTLKKAEKQRKQRIENYKQQIRELEERIRNPPQIEDEVTIDHDRQRVMREIAELQTLHGNLQHDISAVNDDIGRLTGTRDGKMHELSRLDSIEHQRLENLRRADLDTAVAVSWLRENRAKFRMEVFEPAFLSAQVTNMDHVDAIEACINWNQLKTFVCQCEEDYRELNRWLNDSSEGVGRKLRINVWYRPRGDVPPPPLSRDELRKLGFFGFALDFLGCPEGMKYYFQRELNMHRTAIGPDSVDTGGAMDMVMRQGGSCSFITGRTHNQVSRSLYGQKKVQNMTRDVRPARNMRMPQVDERKKRELQQEIEQLKEQYDELKVKFDELKPKDEDLRRQQRDKNKERESVKKRVDRRIAMLTEHNLNKNKLNTLENKLQQEEAEKPVQEHTAELKQKLLHLARLRLKVAQEYTKLVKAFIAQQEKGTRLVLEVAQAEANLAALKAYVEDRSAKLQKLMQDTKVANERLKKLIDEVTAAQNTVHVAQSNAEPEVQKRFKEIEAAGESQRSPDEVLTEMENERAKLELNIATNPQVILQYEAREREIRELEARLAEKDARKKRLEKNIQAIKGKWLPALEQLIASINTKFSAAFERVHCAGEVHIAQDEDDYDKWAIDIMVKFRDSERLQLLTGHRQSGGERSLTTILYLMSLTELARAPFSLVDEINQGMDQRAERLVHNQLVDVTCREDSGQYFLITPKLLPDLAYHERMMVLCVNNGEWLPNTRGIGSLGKLLDNYIAKNPQARARPGK